MHPSRPEPALFPLFAQLAGRDVLVVGGGEVAARKIRALLRAGARVGVVAPLLNTAITGWRDKGVVLHHGGRFRDELLDRVWLVVAASDDATTNRRVATAAAARRLFANVVDDAMLSSFHVPAIIDRAPLQIAISSGGHAPMLARRVREQIEGALDHAIGPLAALLRRARVAIRARFATVAERRDFYRRLFAGAVPALLRNGRAQEAAAALRQELARDTAPRRGRVTLVGAGPGDPGLLTLHGLRALNEADVILHDRLVGAAVLELARRDATCIDVGKQAGNHGITQDGIHALMLEHARAGRHVVRLKGGDPFVFGRGGEELEFLRAHGIACAVVPGITAAVACAAYAGVPLTHRKHAHSVQFLTAHAQHALDDVDLPSLGQREQTLAIYMGVARLDAIRARLLGAGRDGATPIALVENGTRDGQRIIVSTLTAMRGLEARHALASPALLIVGAVAALAAKLHWFGAVPIADDAGLGEGPIGLPSPPRRERAAA